jgi:HEAT repeat protein
MAFYSLTKEQRVKLVAQIKSDIVLDIQKKQLSNVIAYFCDEDTYIRKSAYLAVGKIYFEQPSLQDKILSTLEKLIEEKVPHIRQTTINAVGEIGIKEFEPIAHFFDKGLFDENSSVRNAVIGSVKKMGEKNPKSILKWAKKYLHHPDKEVRREICHGIELRGRTHPQDILPLLSELQNDKTARVRNTLIHVLGQISYKKGCLETVIKHLNDWRNKELTEKAVEEIIDVHDRYKNFAVLSQKQAMLFIKKKFKK